MKSKDQNFRSRAHHGLLPMLILVVVLAISPVRAAETSLRYLAPGRPDVVELLPPPPLADSPEQAADLAEVRTVSRACASNEVATAMSEKKFSIKTFASAIGPAFQPDKLPKTVAFIARVQADAATVTDEAKLHWKRPRPFMVDPSLASGNLEKTFSYPSGHSTESGVVSLVLAEIFPGRSDAILAEGRTIGWHRVEIARHYPTDIYAGRVLARAIVHEMHASADFQKDLAEAKAEVAAENGSK